MDFVTVEEMAKRFSVTPGTITAWRKRLGLPARRMSKRKRGGLVLFNVQEIQAWADRFKQSDLTERFGRDGLKGFK